MKKLQISLCALLAVGLSSLHGMNIDQQKMLAVHQQGLTAYTLNEMVKDGRVSKPCMEKIMEYVRPYLTHQDKAFLFQFISIPHTIIPTDHTHMIKAIAYSPNGQQLACGSFDKTVSVWDMQIDHCIALLNGHDDHVTTVSFNHDGTVLVSGSEDKTVKLWDIDNKECFATLEHNAPIKNLKFVKGRGQDCRHVTSISRIEKLPEFSNYFVKIWDIKTNKCIVSNESHDAPVGYSTAYDRTTVYNPIRPFSMEKWISTITLTDEKTNLPLAQLKASNTIHDMAFSPNGEKIAVSSKQTVHDPKKPYESPTEIETIEVWDLNHLISLHNEGNKNYTLDELNLLKKVTTKEPLTESQVKKLHSMGLKTQPSSQPKTARELEFESFKKAIEAESQGFLDN